MKELMEKTQENVNRKLLRKNKITKEKNRSGDKHCVNNIRKRKRKRK